MLRMLRVIGIVVFAMLVGISAKALWKMHETGELLDRYNSARKANVTMLAFSIIALGTLGYFELTYARRLRDRKGYGGRRYQGEEAEGKLLSGHETANIYSAPATLDAWKGRRTRTSKSRHKQQLEMTGLWMGLLRICSVVMPMAYLGLMAMQLLNPVEDAAIAWVLPAVFAGMALLSIIVAIGIFGKKTWGMSLGYLLAICNLMVFPYGTGIGLFMLVGLVGASAEFAVPAREKRRAKRRNAQAMI
jgi:hypothetical protein